MCHRVDDVVDPELVAKGSHWDRIVGIVGVFPRVAHVAVEINGDHQIPPIVVNTAPVRRPFQPRDDLSSLRYTQVPQTRNGGTLSQIEEYVDKRIFRRDLNEETV